MSRIGRKPIDVPSGVDVKVNGPEVSVKGKLGELTWSVPDGISIAVDGGRVVVQRANEEKKTRSMHGTARSLIANMVKGVNEGYRRELVIQGVGYRAQMQGRKLIMTLGFSHPIEFEAPDGVDIEVKDNVNITVSGADKQQVGLASARIRGYCPAEPYKGKGIKYRDEYVRRKVGKTVA